MPSPYKDTNSKASRKRLESHELFEDFVSDVVVYCVQRGEVDARKARHVYAKRYLHGDMWFKILLHIYTDGHLGKYVATVSSAGRSGGLDDARDTAHTHLMREQMHTHVLEAIVESSENRKGVVLSICPSLIRLERVNQCSFWDGDMLQHGIISSDFIASRGLRTSNREGMVVRSLLPDRFNDRRISVAFFTFGTVTANTRPFRSTMPNTGTLWESGPGRPRGVPRLRPPTYVSSISTVPDSGSSVCSMRYLRSVSNQQKWDTLGAERSGAGWRSGELPEGPVVASSPFGGLSLHLLPAL